MAGGEIRGLKVYSSPREIDRQIDMVEVLRSSNALLGIAEEAIAVGEKAL